MTPLQRLPRSRMLAHVRALLRSDPRLQAVIEKGGRIEPECDVREIRVVMRSAGGEVLGEASHGRPRWWLPARSGRARAIAEDLAAALAAAITDRQRN